MNNRKNSCMRALIAIGLAAPLCLAAPAHATNEQAGFQHNLRELTALAQAEGVSKATVIRMTSGLTFDPRVVAIDRSENTSSPTPLPMAAYLRIHVSSDRIAMGRTIRMQSAYLLARIERRYGVPGPLLLAIWGHETHYGSYTGNFDLVRSLASLAYEGRRRELFTREFVALMKMADMGIPRSRMKGSYAGAFGNPQFLPSVYLRTAVNTDGDGYGNIWTSRADTLASIANYFRQAGWSPSLTWGVRARVPTGLNRAKLKNPQAASACGRARARHSISKSISEWRQLGVIPLGDLGEITSAALFEPDGPSAPAYLITSNFDVILQYNCSNYYALSVGLLANAIAH